MLTRASNGLFSALAKGAWTAAMERPSARSAEGGNSVQAEKKTLTRRSRRPQRPQRKQESAAGILFLRCIDPGWSGTGENSVFFVLKITRASHAKLSKAARRQRAKVFWFFFSKKNCFLALPFGASWESWVLVDDASLIHPTGFWLFAVIPQVP
jgi:hypothetical protein